jgi:hypothetical protein
VSPGGMAGYASFVDLWEVRDSNPALSKGAQNR